MYCSPNSIWTSKEVSACVSSTLFSASTDKTVGVWDSETGERLKRLKGHSSFVNSCYPARRGPQLVCTGSDDGTVKVQPQEPGNQSQYRLLLLKMKKYIYLSLRLIVDVRWCDRIWTAVNARIIDGKKNVWNVLEAYINRTFVVALMFCGCDSYGTYAKRGRSTPSRTPTRCWRSPSTTPAIRSCLEASTTTSRYGLPAIGMKMHHIHIR